MWVRPRCSPPALAVAGWPPPPALPRDDWDVQRHLTEANGAGAAPAAPAPSPSGPLHAPLSGSSGNAAANGNGHAAGGSSSASSSSAGDDGDDSVSDSAAGDAALDWGQRFPQVRAAIEAAVRELGGRVVPKLN